MAKAKKKTKSVSDVFERAQSLLRERKPMTNRNPFVIMPEGSYRLHVYADPDNAAFFRFRIQHKLTVGGQTLKLISPRLTREMNAEIEDIGYDESPLDDRIEELMAGSREDQALAKKIKVTEFVVFYGRIEWDDPPSNDEATEGLIMCTMSDFGKLIRAATDDIGEAELEPDTKFVFQIEREGWDIETATCLDVEDMLDSEIAFVEKSPPLRDRVAPLPLEELRAKLDEASKGKAQRSRRRARAGRNEEADEDDEDEDRVASPSRKRRAQRVVDEDDDDEEEEDEDDVEDEDDEEEEERPRRKAKGNVRAKVGDPSAKRRKAKTGKRDIASELLDDLEED